METVGHWMKFGARVGCVPPPTIGSVAQLGSGAGRHKNHFLPFAILRCLTLRRSQSYSRYRAYRTAIATPQQDQPPRLEFVRRSVTRSIYAPYLSDRSSHQHCSGSRRQHHCFQQPRSLDVRSGQSFTGPHGPPLSLRISE